MLNDNLGKPGYLSPGAGSYRNVQARKRSAERLIFA
jgi:hypothetical protein